jgi:hypothetical protein
MSRRLARSTGMLQEFVAFGLVLSLGCRGPSDPRDDPQLRWARVTGRVVDAHGAAAAGATVTFGGASLPGAMLTSVVGGTPVLTTADGSFDAIVSWIVSDGSEIGVDSTAAVGIARRETGTQDSTRLVLRFGTDRSSPVLNSNVLLRLRAP